MIPHTPKSGQLSRLQGRNMLARRIEAAGTELLDAMVFIRRFQFAGAFYQSDQRAMAEIDTALRALERAKSHVLGITREGASQ